MISKEALEEIEYYSEHPLYEKSARELFEELGFEYEESSDETLIDYYKKYQNLDLELLFNKTKKVFCMTYDVEVDIKLLQAINKQVEELGW